MKALLPLSMMLAAACGAADAQRPAPRSTHGAPSAATRAPATAPAAAPPAPAPAPAAPEPPSLAERLGGRDGIAAIVHGTVERVLADRRISRFFRSVEPAHLEQLMAEQLCAGAGGGCSYSGRSMEEAHHGIRVADAHFDAFIEDLVAALDAAQVPDAEKNELLGLVGPMRAQIVSVRARGGD